MRWYDVCRVAGVSTTAKASGEMGGPTGELRVRLAGGLAALAAATGAFALSMPEEQKLGALVRFVTFHGASTWVNMALFTAVGVLAAVFLASGVAGAGRWGAGVRYVAFPLWVVNTGLGMLSSKLAWGAVNWSEPRLQASFWILIGAAAVVVVDVAIDRPRIAAAADVALVVAFWALLLSSPNLMHPDNPVLNSGWDVKAPFFGMVAAWGAAMACAAGLVRGSLDNERYADAA